MQNKKILFCIAPFPLLWYFNNFIAILVFLLMVLLAMILIIRIIRNKIKKKALWDKMNKTFVLWISASILSLIAFIFSFVTFYIANLVCLAVILLIVFFLARKFRLFKIRIIYLAITFILLIGSIVISGLKIKEIYLKPKVTQLNQQSMSITIENPLGGCSGNPWY